MVKNVRKKCCMKATICARGKRKKFVAAPGQTFLLTYQDWEDVHLVGTEVIVQEVSLSSICHKEAVSERYVRVRTIQYHTLFPHISIFYYYILTLHWWG